jgi:glycerophosphoryl diester phosphodiesterase
VIMPAFELQGHRGARGLCPENTLPSFEIAFDCGVASIETDVHLTADGVPVLLHDPIVNSQLFRPIDGRESLDLSSAWPVSRLTIHQLRSCRADLNPDPRSFPEQDPTVTPLAAWFAAQHNFDAFSPPTLANLFAFAHAYAGPIGQQHGKSPQQRSRAGQVIFDLELKRIPFHPEVIGDDFDGIRPGRLEQRVVEAVTAAGVVGRTTVRSFDHRAVRATLTLEPRLTGAILIAATAVCEPARLVRAAGASIYCPEYQCLDEPQVRQLHAEGMRVIPWTVNSASDWQRLLSWGVDGITTDFPDLMTPQ